MARGLNDLAAVFLYQDDYWSAEPFLRESLDLNKQLLGDGNLSVGIGLSNLASALRGKGDYEEAMALFVEAESTYTRLYGAASSRVTRARLGQASVLDERGSRAGLSIFEHDMGDATMFTAKARLALADCLTSLAQFERADSLLVAALAVETKLLAPDHPLLRQAHETAVRLYDASGHPAESARYRRLLR